MHDTAAEAAGTFADLPLRPELVAALTTLGYEEPTPIQRETIPALVEGRDLLGQAATGTGKTAAFALPLLQRLPEQRRRDKEPMALVLVPTRELAIQVSEAIHKYGLQLGARVLPIYGGQPILRQLKALSSGVDVVVATPGRALDHIGRKTLRMNKLDTVVLDEADEMLDMGFAEDIEMILAEAPRNRQTVLFSATMPSRIDKLARRHLREPVRIEIERPQAAAGEAPLVRQTAYLVVRAHKPAALGRILDLEAPAAAIIFCRTCADVDQLTETLNGRGYKAAALHGGLSQEQRTRVVDRVKTGATELLVATDVAARGLDIDSLTHVINYDVPSAVDSYVHRIGRVGRAGREGVAITLAQPREHRMLKTIERATGQRVAVEKIPTVDDLRAYRLELTRSALRETALEGDLDHFRVVVETLAEDFDLMEIALAAVKLAHEAVGGTSGDEEEIPDIKPPSARPDKQARRSGAGASGGKPSSRRGKHQPDMARLFVGAGRAAGIRPQDIVGAITGESSLTGRDIGTIEITDKFSIVEVAEGSVDEVIGAMRRTHLKGKKPKVRRDSRS